MGFALGKAKEANNRHQNDRIQTSSRGGRVLPPSLPPPETLVKAHFTPPPDSHLSADTARQAASCAGTLVPSERRGPPVLCSVCGGGAGGGGWGVRRVERAQVVSHCRLQQMLPRGADRQVWLQQQEGTEQLSTLYSPCVCLWSHDHRHAHMWGRCASVSVGGCGQTLRYLHKFLVTRVISF